MLARENLNPILHSEGLTRGLGDCEARLLVEWLVEQAEQIGEQALTGEVTQRRITQLCRRGRAIAHFVQLWCHDYDAAAAYQLAATERFSWPLPSEPADAFDLMTAILSWEACLPK